MGLCWRSFVVGGVGGEGSGAAKCDWLLFCASASAEEI